MSEAVYAPSPHFAVPSSLVGLTDCYSDQLWRLHNLYFITDEGGNKVKFTPNWAQRKLLEEMWFLNVILKARQLGFTTFIDILALDEVLWHKDFHAGIIAHTREDVKKIFRNKVRFPYENLPDGVKQLFATKASSANELVFTHGSSISVGTSMRSSTLQFLHVSEHGKICAKYPEKAREIRTGSLNTVHPGQVIFIESTAEGRDGDFFRICKKSLDYALERRRLTRLDFKFHFFPWWLDPRYELDEEETKDTPIPPHFQRYFYVLEAKIGVRIRPGQRAWYVKKSDQQQGDMKREYPSTPREAFEQAVEGAYYSKQMAALRKRGGIGDYPFDPRFQVHVAWDIGRDDTNALWFIQEVAGGIPRAIHYYEDHGESIQFYINYILDWRRDNPSAILGTNYMPHDAEVVDYSREDGLERIEVVREAGLRAELVDKVDSLDDLGEGHQAVRDLLGLLEIDAEECEKGIKCLDHYQKEWDDKGGTWKNRPLHNWASHGAKALEQFARGHRFGQTDTRRKKRRQVPKNWRVI
jgi:hypothetical protein